MRDKKTNPTDKIIPSACGVTLHFKKKNRPLSHPKSHPASNSEGNQGFLSFRMGRELGHGAFGTVFELDKASDSTSQKKQPNKPSDKIDDTIIDIRKEDVIKEMLKNKIIVKKFTLRDGINPSGDTDLYSFDSTQTSESIRDECLKEFLIRRKLVEKGNQNLQCFFLRPVDLYGCVSSSDNQSENSSFDWVVVQRNLGKSLKNLKDSGELSYNVFLEIIPKIIKRINENLEIGIVHCDISPDNIMMTNEKQINIMDYGIAKFEGSVTRPEGKGPYMPQEYFLENAQKAETAIGYINGQGQKFVNEVEISRTADYYAFGVTLDYLAEGFSINDTLRSLITQLQSEKPKIREEAYEQLSKTTEYADKNEVIIKCCV
jgi:serine/threonine protein kinase